MPFLTIEISASSINLQQLFFNGYHTQYLSTQKWMLTIIDIYMYHFGHKQSGQEAAWKINILVTIDL